MTLTNLFALSLLASCTGPLGSDGTGTDGVDDPDDGTCDGTVIDPDCDDEEEFSATVTLSFPDAESTDVTGFTVNGDEPDENEGACDLTSRTCTFLADKADDYDLQLVGSIWLYRPKPVSLTTDGESTSLTWTIEGSGCADETWDPLGETPCENWTPGDYGRIVEGVCQESGGQDDEEEISTHVEDLGDGDVVTIWLMICQPYQAMSGDLFQGVCADGSGADGSMVHGQVSEDGDVYYHWTRDGVVGQEVEVDCP